MRAQFVFADDGSVLACVAVNGSDQPAELEIDGAVVGVVPPRGTMTVDVPKQLGRQVVAKQGLTRAGGFVPVVMHRFGSIKRS